MSRAVTGGGSAAEDDDGGMVLDFKTMDRKDLQRLCVEKNFRADGTTLSLMVAGTS